MRNSLERPDARRTRSASAFSASGTRDRRRLAFFVSLLLIVGFVAWTTATRVGISHGSRPTTWVTQPFGSWPATFPPLEGSSNLRLSLFASFIEGGTIGMTAIGPAPDFGDGGAINGSRFVTGASAGNVASMSVHVRAPLDDPSHRQFQLAIYSDRAGAPGVRLALSAVDTLMADTWNTAPMVTTLEPDTAYWLMYSTNASRAEFNNATVTSVSASSLDQVFVVARTSGSQRAADTVRLIGHPAVSIVLIVGTAWWMSRHDRRAAMRVVLAAVIGVALESVLKWTLFQPYGSYPSGHVLRMTLLAVVVTRISDSRMVKSLVWLGAVAVGVASVIGQHHYIDEIVGGALAGAALGSVAVPGFQRRRPVPVQAPAADGPPIWIPGTDRRAVKRAGSDRRRSPRVPVSANEFNALATSTGPHGITTMG